MPQPRKNELRGYLEVAEGIVRESRAVVLSFDQGDISSRIKSDGSPVTEADFAVEDFIRSRLGQAYPDHGILGEERSETGPGSDFQWIIDPIDGTRSFGHQIPLYGTLLALRHEGQSVLGVISLPALDLVYSGALGLGAHCNGRRVQLGAEDAPLPMENEIIAIGDRRQFVSCGKTQVFDTLMQSEPTVRTYSDCFGHALAIDGRVGAMVDFGVHIWDLAATEVLVREAGGLFVRVNTNDQDVRANSLYNVVFGKPLVVQWVLETVRTADRQEGE